MFQQKWAQPTQPLLRCVGESRLSTFSPIFAKQVTFAKGPRVLLIEDNRKTRNTLACYLSSFGFQVEAIDVAKALQQLWKKKGFDHYLLGNPMYWPLLAGSLNRPIVRGQQNALRPQDKVTFIADASQKLPEGFVNIDKQQLLENIPKNIPGELQYTLLNRLADYRKQYQQMKNLYKQGRLKDAKAIYQHLESCLRLTTKMQSKAIHCYGKRDFQLCILNNLIDLRTLKTLRGSLKEKNQHENQISRDYIRTQLRDRLSQLKGYCDRSLFQDSEYFPTLSLNWVTACIEYATLYGVEGGHVYESTAVLREAIQREQYLLEKFQKNTCDPTLHQAVLRQATTTLQILKILQLQIQQKLKPAPETGQYDLNVYARTLDELVKKLQSNLPQETVVSDLEPESETPKHLEALVEQLCYIDYPESSEYF